MRISSGFSSQLQATPYQEADFLGNVLGPFLQEILSKKRPLVIFGAGSAGRHLTRLLAHHGISITCFGDNQPELAAEAARLSPVLSIESIKQHYQEGLLIVAAAPPHGDIIKKQLLQEGFSPSLIVVPSHEHLLFYTVVSNLYWTKEDLSTHEASLEKVFQLLADSRSKALFLRRLAVLCKGSDYQAFQGFIRDFAQLLGPIETGYFTAPRHDEDYFYFNQPFCPLQEQEVFANIGALTGDCAIEFIRQCHSHGVHYRQILNFEPDPGNFALLSEKMQQYPAVTSYPYGLWSEDTRLRFSNEGPGTCGAICETGEKEIEVRSLDALLPGADITLIKMDVEGAEMKVLLGAQETIQRMKPKLAISIYHKRDDIFEIPLLLHQLNPDYRFYLGHYCSTFDETVLFAIP